MNFNMWQIKQANEGGVVDIASVIKQAAPITFANVGTQEQLDKWINHHTQPQIILANLKTKGTKTNIQH